MGHVKQKKSTSSNTSTPPDSGTELFTTKEHFPRSTMRELHSRPAYPEQLNVEELISQINSRNSHSEITNDSNNNNSNNNTIHRTPNQQCPGESIDVEKGTPEERIRRHRRPKPLYRRLITFIRNLWIGAKFNVGSDGKQSALVRYFQSR